MEKEAAMEIQILKRNFEKKLANEKHGNSRPFYSYRRTKNRVTTGPLKNDQENMVSDDEEMTGSPI